VLNRRVVDLAVKAGVATNCEIARLSRQDRKNYFYPDLPKAYQISQYDLPLCAHGHLNIETASGEKRIGITRIHIEEDAGKLIHDGKNTTLIDLNRCGVPLIGSSRSRTSAPRKRPAHICKSCAPSYWRRTCPTAA
jgi:aspartyl-tRNA(Asn)/glutamyl-tRNA(Gln) amidotransferase subunit B